MGFYLKLVLVQGCSGWHCPMCNTQWAVYEVPRRIPVYFFFFFCQKDGHVFPKPPVCFYLMNIGICSIFASLFALVVIKLFPVLYWLPSNLEVKLVISTARMYDNISSIIPDYILNSYLYFFLFVLSQLCFGWSHVCCNFIKYLKDIWK